MSRDFFRLEKGIHVVGENADSGVFLLFGSDLAGTNAQENDAEVGSLYQRTNGELYQKNSAGSGTDKWVRIATIDDVTSINWRPELVRFLTATVAPVEGGTVDVSAFTDADGSYTGADTAIGEFIAFGSGGTEVLGKISNLVGDTATITYVGFNALADNDAIMVRNYLPDQPADQENAAIVLYNGSDYVKLSDFDWSLATGINLSSNYSSGVASGDPSNGDSVEEAIQKLDGNVDAIDQRTGSSQGDTNMGTYTGISSIVSDNASIKTNIQELGTESVALRSSLGNSGSNMGSYTGNILTDGTDQVTLNQELSDAIEGIVTRTSLSAVTTAQTLDSVLVDDIKAVVWDVWASLDSAPERVKMITVSAVHDGTGAADASNVDDSAYAKLKIGANFNTVLAVDLDGTGAAQTMRLRVSAAAAITVHATRRTIV